ncbi:SAP domain-containing protein [uncultured Brachyspira sp.]|uniref:SAP domain-containing protein n=1 Tax=uncultured Brachyspira sp. TaxID=221953 RepID=UPI00262C8757|nr:SAP domain-containing protein [uncultured Brachyspira sp.]
MRPNFENIKSYQEFIKYYWYYDELKTICKNLNINHIGNKKELNKNIEEYFNGNLIPKKKIQKLKKINNKNINLDSKLLECGFSFNKQFRELFSKYTGIEKFKFNADMAAVWKKVREDNDKNFTIKDMIDVYYKKNHYAKYDNSSCQWNKFLKDFCNDEKNNIFKNKLKSASIIWNIIKNSNKEKIYTYKLVEDNYDK